MLSFDVGMAWTPARQAPAFILAIEPSFLLPAGTPALEAVPARFKKAATIKAAFAASAPASFAAFIPLSMMTSTGSSSRFASDSFMLLPLKISVTIALATLYTARFNIPCPFVNASSRSLVSFSTKAFAAAMEDKISLYTCYTSFAFFYFLVLFSYAFSHF